MTPPAPLTGGCGCGAVRFELSEPPSAAAYCHCGRCRHRTGTGMQASARVEPGSVSVTAGADQLTTWMLEDGLVPDDGLPRFDGRLPG
ncbi:MAG: GFA family protein [Solirubrobacterales bacterium]|nr:GFA family protein [Solirubrobacterales bacterium]